MSMSSELCMTAQLPSTSHTLERISAIKIQDSQPANDVIPFC